MQTNSKSWSGPLVTFRPDAEGRVTAQVVGLPEVQATAATREQALQGVRQLLRQWLDNGRLTILDGSEENPWRAYAGWAGNDPEYGQFLDELKRQREEMDGQSERE